MFMKNYFSTCIAYQVGNQDGPMDHHLPKYHNPKGKIIK